jgi:hypothetical protein
MRTALLVVASLLPVGPGQEPDCPDFRAGGSTYRISKGNAYRAEGGRWVLFRHLYDPEFYPKNYAEQDGKVFRKAEGRLIETRRGLAEGFEDYGSLRDLIGEKPGWNSFTLQSPRAPKVPDYVALRKRILTGADFLDNRIEVESRVVHSGKRSLKFSCAPASADMVCAKASIQSELIHFKRGDDLWYAAWYYMEEGLPQTLVDFETTWIDEHPGPRLFIAEDGTAHVELKWATKPTYRQRRPTAVQVPRRQWVRFRIHLKLMEDSQGVIEVWQDGRKIIDATGQTLPLRDSILNSLEVGISANGHGQAATMYVDDVVLSDQPIQHP